MIVADILAPPGGCSGMCKQQTICGIDILCFEYIDQSCECPDEPYCDYCCPLEIMDLAEGQMLDASNDDDPVLPGIQLKVSVDATCWLVPHECMGMDEVWIGKCDDDRHVNGYQRIPTEGICEEVVDLDGESGCLEICTEIIGGGTSDKVKVCIP